MGISIRAYARHRGVSDAAVRKAIKTGRISAEPDGTIEPTKADLAWAKHTDPSQQRTQPSRGAGKPATAPTIAQAPAREPAATVAAEPSIPATGGATFVQARTANEVIKAQTNKVRLSRLKGELIDRSKAIAQVFKLARSERDAWLNWPSRVSAQIAAELGCEAHQVHVLIEREVRRHLNELGTLSIRIDG